MSDQQAAKHNVLRDLRHHKMTIECDTNEHRCLHFGRPGSGIYSFRIITWPGALAIEGDCGSFTFSRLRDMFGFFRSSNGEISVNLSYWAEKLVAISSPEALRVVDESLWDARVLAAFKSEWAFESGDDHDKALAELTDAYTGLIGRAPASRAEAVEFATDYVCPVTDQSFADVWEWQIESFGFHFVWCAHAIVWAIKRYDLHKFSRTQADEDHLTLGGPRLPARSFKSVIQV